MDRQRRKQQTFEAILQSVAPENARRIMERARTANRLAKSAGHRRTRVGAYRVKTDALVTLNERFPERITVSSDPQYGSYFVLVKDNASRFGLHAPAGVFAGKVR
jgi:hypothetical protein